MSVHDSDINKVLTCIARGDELWEIQRAVDGLLMSQDVSPEEPADDFLKWLYLAIEGSTSGEYYLSTSDPWLEQPDVWPACLRGSELWYELFRAVGQLPPKEIERCMVVVTAELVSKWPNYQWLLDHRPAKSALTPIGTAPNAGIPSVEAVALDYVTLQQTAAVIGKSKGTLENWKRDDPKFPPPDVIGGNGRANEWRWSNLRPYLQTRTKRELPEVHPGTQGIGF